MGSVIVESVDSVSKDGLDTPILCNTGTLQKAKNLSTHSYTLSKLHSHDSRLIYYPDIPRMIGKDGAKTSHLAIFLGHLASALHVFHHSFNFSSYFWYISAPFLPRAHAQG